MSAHVPAWKRLGLKLKGPASNEPTPSSAGPNAGAKPSAQVPNAHQARVNGSPASALKRKLPSSASTPNAVAGQTPNKKPRREDQPAANQGTPSSLRKSVSFADDTKDDAKVKTTEKKAKKKKVKKTAETPNADFNLEPSLNYLRQWHTAKESWKFNKNHQTLLIKYLFDGDKVPSSDIPVFHQYIRDLKGFVRTRLRETAAEIKKKDMEAGAGAFPASLKEKESKQKQYEETISRFLRDLQQHQQQPNDPSKNANGKRTLDEVEYVFRIATPEVKQRLLKRIRAELVLGELSDSEESTTSTVTATSTSSSSSASSGQEATAAITTTTTTSTTAAAAPDRTTTRRSDGSQQPAKRRRLRNVRTDIGDDDSSSSESESESGESSSSESDDSEDEEMDMAPDANAAESSSSSSSSSESEAESGAESEEEESGSGSSSSDDED
ncbi:hypothetical protein C8A00DRAFT_10679 [Chaetomidium leptoderma]|uniref:WKF domain-containing protein n=1 Tax=Chaetomidium leptoderma TaxID=669021 RepID=A0AAN6VVL9_9PEZI|nr:hypothetical protein C8A00DRAFT_10679 [Chaetomidium leptoderma]